MAPPSRRCSGCPAPPRPRRRPRPPTPALPTPTPTCTSPHPRPRTSSSPARVRRRPSPSRRPSPTSSIAPAPAPVAGAEHPARDGLRHWALTTGGSRATGFPLRIGRLAGLGAAGRCGRPARAARHSRSGRLRRAAGRVAVAGAGAAVLAAGLSGCSGQPGRAPAPGAVPLSPGPRLGGGTGQACARDDVHPHPGGSAWLRPPSPRPAAGGASPRTQGPVFRAGETAGRRAARGRARRPDLGPRWCRPARGGTAYCSRAVPTAPPGGSSPAARALAAGDPAQFLPHPDPDRRPQAQRGRWRQVAGDLDSGRGRCGNADTAGRTFLLASLAPPRPTYSPLILPLGFTPTRCPPSAADRGQSACTAGPTRQYSAMRSATAACAYPQPHCTCCPVSRSVPSS
jgi:hypothetical protein